MSRKGKTQKPLREEVHSEVYVTTQYDLFDLFPENRNINPAHVAWLQARVEEKNLLHLNPMIVDGEGRILDGQHRLRVAENLGVPIYYVLTQNGEMGIEDVAGTNSATRRWARTDYLHYWCERGSQHYLALRDFWKKHERWLTLSAATAVCLGESASSTLTDLQRNAFNTGKFQILDMRFALKFAEAMRDFLPHFRHATDRAFMAAVCYLLRHPQYDHGRMRKKIEAYPALLQPQRDRDNYLENLEELYNYYSHSSRVRFR